jgi:hypothetical protein
VLLQFQKMANGVYMKRELSARVRDKAQMDKDTYKKKKKKPRKAH